MGGSLVEDVCAMLTARRLFLATSSLDASLVLLGSAEEIFVPLPPKDFAPGMISFGYASRHYLQELCIAFDGAVIGYEFAYAYYMGDNDPSRRWLQNVNRPPVMEIAAIPADRTLHFPASQIHARMCGDSGEWK